MPDTARPEDMVPHCNTDICTRCRKAIHPGHRIIRVHISHGMGFNPNNVSERGLFISDEYEFTHVDCYDPFLRNRLGL